MNDLDGINITPLFPLTMKALTVVKELGKGSIQGQDDTKLSKAEWDFIEECNPPLILNLILAAVAAKEWVDSPLPSVKMGDHLRDAVERIWK